MTVVEVVIGDLVVVSFSRSQSRFKLSYLGLKVPRLQVELLLPYGAILLVALHCLFEEGLLTVEHLNELLALCSHSICIFIGQHNRLHYTRWLGSRDTRDAAASASFGYSELVSDHTLLGFLRLQV